MISPFSFQHKKQSLLICTTIIHVMVFAQVGKRFPVEKTSYVDSVSGKTIYRFTTDATSDTKIYQTHPQWTADNQYIIFRSNRTADKKSQAFAVHEATGTIIQLTEGNVNTGNLNVARLSNTLFYIKDQQLIELNLDKVFADSKAGKQIDSNQYEKVIFQLPKGYRESGGFTLDADETFAYMGLSYTEDTTKKWCMSSINLKTGAYKKIADIPFWLGHIQANPFVKGEILYCWETGGDSPQRMWLINADGTNNRPLYEETKQEWVTHEIWQDKDHVVFNLMGHLPYLRTKPHGLVRLNIRNNEVETFKNAANRGFWHCAGTPDGKKIVADTFLGELYNVDVETGTSTLLTTGHYEATNGIPKIHSHHTISPDGKKVLFNSGKFGNTDLLLIYL